MTDELDATTKGLLGTLKIQQAEEKEAERSELARKFARAQAQYDAGLKPVFDALAALPGKNGTSFEVQQTKASPEEGLGPWASITLYFTPDPGSDLPPPPSANTSIDISIVPVRVPGALATQINVAFSSGKSEKLHSFEEAGRTLANWVNENAPEHILDLGAAVRSIARNKVPSGGVG